MIFFYYPVTILIFPASGYLSANPQIHENNTRNQKSNERKQNIVAHL
jgi:hypothetical protein